MGFKIDITGKKINRVTALKWLPNTHGKWLCRCDCGNEFETEGSALRAGETKECKECTKKTTGLKLRHDLTGKIFGGWTVIKYHSSKDGVLWECKCACGDIYIRTGDQIKRYKQCLKCRHRAVNDMLGKTFGKWTVIGKSNQQPTRKKSTFLFWDCKCECGNIRRVGGYALRSNKSSGCPNCVNKIAYGEAAFNYLYGTYKCNAAKRGIEWALTKDEFRVITKSNCYYTGLPPSTITRRQGGDYVYNGVDRVHNNEGYTLDNSVPCNSRINKMKMDLPYSDFIELCNMVSKTIAAKGERDNKLKAV